ncbi:NUDIX hydrolase [Trueperella bernardiae]|uniref:NUDIX hydrolase n=1 Tax=Trueperella bernardiae TaxID=59561 RepID=UPI00288C0722|nr:NUDIX hydrolase [Trueperella bernardiae]
MSVDIRAAGAVVWRRRSRTLEVLIVHRPTWKDWSLPKGKVKGEETLHECCIREMKEETGHDVVLGVPLGWQHYTVSSGKSKEVRYWAATVADKGHPALAARGKVQPASKKEIDDARWVTVKDAHKMLTHKGDRKMLQRLMDLEEAGVLCTTPVLVTRHARATKRAVYNGPEQTRPLTTTGVVRAKRLVPLLSVYGVDRVVASPWKRCLDTVAPYAKATGLELETREALTEAAHVKKPKKMAAVLSQVLGKGRATAVCVHRPTLPTVLDVLKGVTPHHLRRQLPGKDPWLKTGEIMVVHVAKKKDKAVVIAFEKIRPAM